MAAVLPVIVLAPTAAVLVTVQIMQILGTPFDVGARIVAAMFTISLVAAVALTVNGRLIADLRRDLSWLPLLGIGVVFSVLSFVLVRYGADDTHYLPNAVYFLAHPQTPMGFEAYYIHSDDGPFRAISWINSYAGEYALAALSRVLEVEFLALYWSGKSIVFAFLVPFAWYGLLRRFALPHVAVVVAIVVMLLVFFIMGETYNSYGNWFLTGLFHGKTIVIAVGLPLTWAYLIAFFDDPNFRNWCYLAIVPTAMIGLSTMAGFILPVSVFTLFLGYAFAEGRKFWTHPLRILGAGGAFGYLVIVTLYIRLNINPMILVNDGVMNGHYPASYLGQLAFFTDLRMPVSLVVAILATALSIKWLDGRHRRFVLWWSLIYVALYLTPLTAPLLINHLTTTNTYWRLFLAFPFPLVVGISVAKFVEMGRHREWPWRGAWIIGAAAVLAAPHVLLVGQIQFGWDRTSPSVIRSIHSVALGGVRLQPGRLSDSRKILEITPPGPMLAPHPINRVIPILSGRHPQLNARNLETRFWFQSRGDPARGNRRVSAGYFLEGLPQGRENALFEVLSEEPNLRSIVIQEKALARDGVAARLSEAGFVAGGRIKSYRVFIHPPAAAKQQ